MNQLFTLSAAVLCSISAYAQQPQKPVNPLLPKPRTVTPVSNPTKTTGADTRLIATVNFTYGASSFEVEDSSVLSYTGNNGWDGATQGWKFDTGTIFTFDQSTMSWDADGGAKQVVTNNRIMSTLYRILISGTWHDDEKSSYTYTTGGLLATEQYESNSGSGLEPNNRSSHTYNSDKQIAETVYEHWNSSSSQFQIDSRTLVHYNTAKLMDTMRMQSWIAMTSSWQDNMRMIQTYTNGKLTQTLQQTPGGSGWDDAYRTLYTYDGSGNQTGVESETWNTGTQSWDKTYRTEHAYNSAGDMTEEKGGHYNATTFIYDYKTAYTYNQFHHILTEESQSWNQATSLWFYDSGDDYRTVNYYEAYTNDVKNVASNVAQLSVYPVPAKDQITVSASFRQTQPVTITVRDMSGRIVKQLADQAGAQFHKSISVADIPAGNYIINVNGTTEVATKMITIGN